jgi:predicted nucleic acid-binding protein
VIAVDANVLIYANRAELPLHTVARTRLAELAEGAVPWGLPVAAAWGFVRIVTQQIFDPPTPSGQAGLIHRINARAERRVEKELIGGLIVMLPMLRTR